MNSGTTGRMKQSLPYYWCKLSAAARSACKPKIVDVVSDLDSISLEDIGAGYHPTSSRPFSSSTAKASVTPPEDPPDQDEENDGGGSEEDFLRANFGRTGQLSYSAATVSVNNFATSALFRDKGRLLDPETMLDRQLIDEQGLQRWVVYLPHEIAADLQRKDTFIAIDSLVRLLDAALTRSGTETLLIAKVATDAYLVNARRIQQSVWSVNDSGSWNEYFMSALRSIWQYAVENWTGDSDKSHSASDLLITASWFQAWWAADDTSGGGQPIIEIFHLQRLLPGDWMWVLDHLEIAGAPEG